MNKEEFTNYYKLLEVPVNSTEEEIKKAFRKKAKEYHPDKNKNKENDNYFLSIKTAYEILTDENKRLLYDTQNHKKLKHKKKLKNNKSKPVQASDESKKSNFTGIAVFMALFILVLMMIAC